MKFGKYLVMKYEDEVQGFEIFDMSKDIEDRSHGEFRIFSDDMDVEDMIKALQYITTNLKPGWRWDKDENNK